MTYLPTSKCTIGDCGVPIVWAQGTKEDGSLGKFPLDPRPPVYFVEQRGELVICTREKQAMVLHHATCRKLHEQRAAGGTPQDLAGENARLKKELQLARDRIVVLTSMLPVRPKPKPAA